MNGQMNHLALYTEGNIIGGTFSGDVVAFDGVTGEQVWNFNPGGYWNFWGAWPAAAYGIYYQLNFDANLYAINATNGNVIWKYKCPGMFYPSGPTVADGKVYVTTGSAEYRDVATGVRGVDESVCLDAFTGEVIYRVEIDNAFNQFQSAYGNIYFALAQGNQAPSTFHGHSGFTPGEVWCITGKPRNWAMYGATPNNSFRGAGPQKLHLKWKVTTGGPVTASPTIADGVVYIGSFDHKIYAFDAYTGAKKWEFETGYQVKSSVAVIVDRVFTGIDDGNAYCLNAVTGTQIWKTPVTDKTTYLNLNFVPQTRSSPKVVNGKVYVGSIDNNFYILSASNGQILKKFNSGGQILCSPAVVDGAVYFYSNKPGANATYYKINADTAAVIWQFDLPYLRTGGSRLVGPGGGDIASAPVVVDGAIYQAWDGGSADPDAGGLYKINATTGAIMWNAKTYWTRDTISPLAPMIYYEGVSRYVSTLAANATDPEGIVISWRNRNLIVQNATYERQAVVLCNDRFYNVIGLNATDGTQLWKTYVGRETNGFSLSDPGNLYATCEAKVIFNIDVHSEHSGEKLSYVEPPALIWCTPALYDGMLYVGSLDYSVQCYGEQNLEITPSDSPSPEPSLAQPIEPEPAEPTQAAETPFITAEVAVIAAVAVASVIGIVAFWALRKRK